MANAVRYLNPETLSAPTGYSHIAEVSGGRTIYIAGQVAFDKAGTLVGKGDFGAQATQVFENLKLALAAVGATFLVLLVATRELGARDVQAIKSIRAKRGPGGEV